VSNEFICKNEAWVGGEYPITFYGNMTLMFWEEMGTWSIIDSKTFEMTHKGDTDTYDVNLYGSECVCNDYDPTPMILLKNSK